MSSDNVAQLWDQGKYKMLPPHMREGVYQYITKGQHTGAFLRAVICNDLKMTFVRADTINIYHVKDFVDFFYNHAPMACWGSEEAYEFWTSTGGLEGKHA